MPRYDELEFEEALPLLSMAVDPDDQWALSRRRFLQGALAVSAGAAMPLLRHTPAGAAEGYTPLGANEGVIVSLFLGGGNDGLNTVAPISGPARARYDALRGGLAIPAGQLLPLDGGWGLHPGLAGLHRRYGAGRVAVVEGVGLPASDLSHFTAIAKSMQGRVDGARSGWLGRFLDGLPDGGSGLRGLAVSSSVPLTLVGERSRVTSIPSGGGIWGGDRSAPGEAALIDAVAAFGAQPTGLGPLGDAVAGSGRAAVTHAARFTTTFQPDPGAAGLGRDLLLAARLINLDLGARAVGLTFGGWDTHATQAGLHDLQLRTLDGALEVFFANLHPRFRNRVTVLVQSEFGRRPAANAGGGTDHGTAAPMLVIGDNVRGGRHGAPPSLDRLDERGNLVPSVDFRAVYASLLEQWLGADADQVLGGRFGGLDLVRAAPGSRPA